HSLQHVRASDVYLAAPALPPPPPVVPLVLNGPAPGRIRLALAGRSACPLAPPGRLPGRSSPPGRLVVDRASRAGHGDLSQGGLRSVPAASSGPRGHPPGRHGGSRQGRVGGDRP